MLSFDLPSTAGGTIEPLLTVTTEDGEIGRRPLRVDIPPQQVERPAVDPRGGQRAQTAVFDRPPMELFIDEAVVARDGLLRIEGWVVCLVQIEAVEVFVEGERIGQAEFGRVRPSFGISTSARSSRTIPVRAKARTVMVFRPAPSRPMSLASLKPEKRAFG